MEKWSRLFLCVLFYLSSSRLSTSIVRKPIERKKNVEKVVACPLSNCVVVWWMAVDLCPFFTYFSEKSKREVISAVVLTDLRWICLILSQWIILLSFPSVFKFKCNIFMLVLPYSSLDAHNVSCFFRLFGCMESQGSHNHYCIKYIVDRMNYCEFSRKF